MLHSQELFGFLPFSPLTHARSVKVINRGGEIYSI